MGKPSVKISYMGISLFNSRNGFLARKKEAEKEGMKEGRKEGRKQRRMEGKKEGWKEGWTDGPPSSLRGASAFPILILTSNQIIIVVIVNI